jgi:hypothetical protein
MEYAADDEKEEREKEKEKKKQNLQQPGSARVSMSNVRKLVQS